MKPFQVRPNHQAIKGDSAVISTLLREPARIAAMRATPDGLRRLLAKASARVSQCQKYPAMMRRHWDAVQKMVEECFWPAEDYKPYFSLLLSMIDVCLGATAALHEGLEEAQASANDLTALDDTTTSLRALRAEASGFWDWMTAPPEKRTLRTTAEIRAAMARGEYISVEQAMLEAGLELS
jgi:hypothetical protein